MAVIVRQATKVTHNLPVKTRQALADRTVRPSRFSAFLRMGASEPQPASGEILTHYMGRAIPCESREPFTEAENTPHGKPGRQPTRRV
jgi:hypothetical protein